MSDYMEFLKTKSQLGGNHGFDPTFLPEWLFDFQKSLVEWAVRKGRGAWLIDCGMGKGPMGLVWSQNVVEKTNRNVLVSCPLAVSHQLVREGEKFGIEIHRSSDGQPKGKITVTNYERLHLFTPADYAGMWCDESGAIKNYSGVTKNAVTEFMRSLPYRLLGSATSAPNDTIELGTHSEALGELGYMDMLAMYFKNDQNTCDSGRRYAMNGGMVPKFRFKKHAETHFWRWVCSWARAARKPSDLGFDDMDFILPPLIEQQHIIHKGFVRPGELFSRPAIGKKEELAEARETIQERCEKAAELASQHERSVAWCNLNPEGDLLEKLIPDCVQVAGSDPDDEKEEKILAFLTGQAKRMVTKSRIAGLGLNLQMCNHATYFPNHCYDETTELLTRGGWKTFNDVSLFDGVATINPHTLFFEWQSPTDLIWNHYSGPMVHFSSGSKTSRSFDLLVTPNHRMFVKRCGIRYSVNCDVWGFKTAEELSDKFKRQEYRLLSACKGFNGSEIDSVSIPEYYAKSIDDTDRLNKRGDKRGLTVEAINNLKNGMEPIRIKAIGVKKFMELAGWYISEGDCGIRKGECDGQIRIVQSSNVNPKYRMEIINLLESIHGLNVYSKTDTIRCCSKQLANFLVDQFGTNSHKKRIPRWVKELGTDSLEILRDTMLKGDGCSNSRGGTKVSYRTVSKQLADDFVEICIKTGIRASAHHRKSGGTGKYKDNLFWEVSLARENIEPSIHIKPMIVNYDGMIGCVTVPNGTLVVRRNGIPVVSGNSYEGFYQIERRFWRFGQENPVTFDIVTTPGGQNILKNLQRKATAADKMFTELVKHMHDAMWVDGLRGFEKKMEVAPWVSKINASQTNTVSI